jgi:hypothetical protein
MARRAPVYDQLRPPLGGKRGQTAYQDVHLGEMAQNVRYGFSTAP